MWVRTVLTSCLYIRLTTIGLKDIQEGLACLYRKTVKGFNKKNNGGKNKLHIQPYLHVLLKQK